VCGGGAGGLEVGLHAEREAATMGPWTVDDDESVRVTVAVVLPLLLLLLLLPPPLLLLLTGVADMQDQNACSSPGQLFMHT